MEKLSPPVWIFLLPIFMIVALSLLMVVLLRGKEPPPEEGWHGAFYYNPNDPSLVVPKRYGIGYTLNFSNPWSWVVMLMIFAAVTVPLVVAAFFVRFLPHLPRH